MASVRLDHLSKIYRGGVVALQDLTVTIPHGEFVCILGPSGSGKSTVLKLIAGIEEASGGRIFFDQQEVTHVTPERRDIAMVFQSYALYPHMTVAENIGFPLKLRKVAKEDRSRQIQEVAHLLGIHSLLSRYPRQLSGGERQRVALGRAIVRNPRVFLLDEPLSNLDVNLRASMRQELKRLHELLGVTFIYATHDQDDALAMGDRVLVLANGRLQQYDTARRVYHLPVNRFVASFIGRLPMNLIAGSLEVKGDRLLFRTEDLTIEDLTGLRAQALATLREGRDGMRVTLGIRPDAITVRGGIPMGPAKGVVAGKVESLEVVEPQVYATVLVGKHRIIARVPEDEVLEPYQPARLFFTSSQLHLFDSESGVRLNFEPGDTVVAAEKLLR